MQRQFNFQPSPYLALALIAMHSAAMLSLWVLALPLWAHLTLALLLLASLLHHLRRDAWLSAPSSWVSLWLEGDRIELTARNGQKIAGKIMPDSLISPLLSVLKILPQDAHRARCAIILPDSLDDDSFRQLRVNLMWGR